MTPARFPHSDTPGSTLGCQLPRAYRRLLRPSSALDAKASTTCPSQLVTHTTNPTPTTNKGSHQTTATNPQAGTRLAMHTSHNNSKSLTNHKEPTHPPQSERACHNKQSDPPKNMGLKDARVHYPDLKQQPHTRHHPRTPHTVPRAGTQPGLLPAPYTPGASRYRSPKPPTTTTHTYVHKMRTGVRWAGASDSSEPQQCVCLEPRPGVAGSCRHPMAGTIALSGGCGLFPHLPKTPPTPGHERSRSGCVLLRKEVIQPHLPVRLPCYDFVPIASPTFDHSLRKRLGRGLRVLPTFVT